MFQQLVLLLDQRQDARQIRYGLPERDEHVAAAGVRHRAAAPAPGDEGAAASHTGHGAPDTGMPLA